MKKSKIISGAALAGIAAFGLTACKGNDEPTLDISVVYKSDQGVSYKQQQSYEVDGEVYSNGSLLPMWQAIEEKFNVTINDAGDYQGNSTEASMNAFMNNGNKGVHGENMELVMGTLKQVQTLATAGDIIDLSQHFDKMPNFSAYLESHPSIKNQLKQQDGGIYSTAYFDGVDDVEKYFMISSVYVKKILDEENPNFDTVYYDGNGNVSTFKSEYTSYVKDKSYEALITNTQGEAETIQINIANNIIDTQKGLTNGKALTEALRKYIDETYMNLKDSTGAKLYEKRSDVFLSNRAVYNVDDFIALWRCIKTNAQYLTNGAKKYIDVFVPRSNDSNRQRQVMELMQMFGQKGGSAEKERLYFDQQGELRDARTQESSYAALNKINELYREGLIVQNYDGDASTTVTWRDTKLNDGTCAVLYDYAQSTAAVIKEKNIDKVGLVNILPPVVDWKITEKDGEELPQYFHFTEDTRSLKTGAWVIPTNCDEDMLDTALAVMDYFYSDEGADLCDFGPNTTTYRKAVTEYDENGKRIDKDPNSLEDGVGIYKGETYVVVADRIFDEITAMNERGISGGWFEYYTRYVGNSLGFGNIRSSGLEYQFVEQEYMKPAMSEISKAVANGSFLICDTKAHEGSSLFFQCVPTQFPLSESEQQKADSIVQTELATSWAENSKSKSCGYTQMIKNGVDSQKLGVLKGQFDQVNQAFLEMYKNALARMSK